VFGDSNAIILSAISSSSLFIVLPPYFPFLLPWHLPRPLRANSARIEQAVILHGSTGLVMQAAVRLACAALADHAFALGHGLSWVTHIGMLALGLRFSRS